MFIDVALCFEKLGFSAYLPLTIGKVMILFSHIHLMTFTKKFKVPESPFLVHSRSALEAEEEEEESAETFSTETSEGVIMDEAEDSNVIWDLLIGDYRIGYFCG